jgi:tRNA (adenine57-N1/adenine58-N1)-methyltransferase
VSDDGHDESVDDPTASESDADPDPTPTPTPSPTPDGSAVDAPSDPGSDPESPSEDPVAAADPAGQRPVLLVHEDREYLRLPGEELHTDLGVVDVPADVQPGDRLETHLGEPFSVRPLRGPDLFDHFERTGAPMMPRDVGLIVGHTGAAAGDRVLDAGTGTGVLAAYLGRLGAEVVTYERDPEFATVARENVRLAGVADRVDVRTGDVLAALDATPDDGHSTSTGRGPADGDDRASARDRGQPEGAASTDPATPPIEGTFDLVTLDTADAPAVVERVPDLLVDGGFLATYTPFVEGTRAVVEAARRVGFAPETFETIQRRLDVDERGTRPSTAGVGHTGFLTFARAPPVGEPGTDDRA